MGAEVLGGRLLGEVEVVELGELLSSLRDLQNSGPRNHFGIPAFDALVYPAAPQHVNPETNAEQPQTRDHDAPAPAHSATTRQNIPQKFKHPVVELVSTAPGAGKTHLLYLITCIAVLPATFHGTSLCGKRSAVVVIDPESRFNIPRLAEVMLEYILNKLNPPSSSNDNPNITTESNTPPIDRRKIDPSLRKDLKEIIKSSLQHIHIFHPQTISILLSTIKTLPTYLFPPSPHPSTHRAIHTVLLPSIDTFAWEIRSQQTSTSSATHTSPYTLLTSHLNKLSTMFRTPIVTTSLALSLDPFRSSLPPSWMRGVDVRLGVKRVEGKRFREGVAWEDVKGVVEGMKERRHEFEVRIVGGGRGKEGGFRFGIAEGVWVCEGEMREGE